VVTSSHFTHCLDMPVSGICPLSMKVYSTSQAQHMHSQNVCQKHHLQMPCCQTIAPECLVVALKRHHKCINKKRAGTFSLPRHRQYLAGYRLRICNNCSGDHPRKQLLLGIYHTPPVRHLRSCPRSRLGHDDNSWTPCDSTYAAFS